MDNQPSNLITLSDAIRTLEDDLQTKLRAYAVPGVQQNHPRSHVSALLVLEKRAGLIRMIREVAAEHMNQPLCRKTFKLIINQTRNVSLNIAEIPDDEEQQKYLLRNRIIELLQADRKSV